MKWTIQQLQKKRTIDLNETIDVGFIKERDKQIRHISPVQVNGHGIVSGDTVTFRMNIKGTMTLPCSRTLEDVDFPFSIEAKENFIRATTNDGESMLENDEDTHVIEGDVIDLLPYIIERILLEIPLQIFSENAKNTFPKGEDWQLLSEENKHERIDPRLADLKKFFDK